MFLFGLTSKPVSAGGRSIVMTEAAPGAAATSRRRPGTVLHATDQHVLVTRGGVLAACRRRELRFLPLLDDEWVS